MPEQRLLVQAIVRAGFRRRSEPNNALMARDLMRPSHVPAWDSDSHRRGDNLFWLVPLVSLDCAKFTVRLDARPRQSFSRQGLIVLSAAVCLQEVN